MSSLEHLYECVFMFGGGFDSVCTVGMECLGSPTKAVYAIHVDYGQKAAVGERAVLRYMSKRFKNLVPVYVDTPLFGHKSNSLLLRGRPAEVDVPRKYILEGRNFFLALIGAGYGKRVAFSFPLETDNPLSPPDISREWCLRASRWLSLEFNQEVVVYSACSDIEKEMLVIWAWSNIPDMVMRAYTCYEYPPCKRCFRCKWRKQMLNDLAKASKGPWRILRF